MVILEYQQSLLYPSSFQAHIVWHTAHCHIFVFNGCHILLHFEAFGNSLLSPIADELILCTKRPIDITVRGF